MLVLAIFVLGIGGTFQYGFQISVLNSPSPVSGDHSFIFRDNAGSLHKEMQAPAVLWKMLNDCNVTKLSIKTWMQEGAV